MFHRLRGCYTDLFDLVIGPGLITGESCGGVIGLFHATIGMINALQKKELRILKGEDS